jgi:hypothetical protein
VIITGEGLAYLGVAILFLIVARVAWKVTGGRGGGKK